MPGTSIDKALAVLALLTTEHSLTEIAREVGLPRSTAHQVLGTLVDHGFAVAAAGRYGPGPAALTLAGAVLADWNPGQQASEQLRQLRDRTGLTVQLAVLLGDHLVHVEQIAGRLPYRLATRLGAPLPLHATAAGKAVLAAVDPEQARAVLARVGTPGRTEATRTDPESLLAELAAAAPAGFLAEDEEYESGVRSIAAAVLDRQGHPVGAVSIATLVFERSAHQLAELGPPLVGTAEQLTRLFCNARSTSR